MDINKYAKIYFNLPEEERDVNEWVPLLDTFIHSICHTWKNIETQEDRYQIAWAVVMKAIKYYDPDSGCRFSSFLCACINNEFKQIYRTNTNRSHLPALDPKNPDNGLYVFKSLEAAVNYDGTLFIKDVIADEKSCDSYKYSELVNEIEEFKKKYCNDRERYILNRREDGCNLQEIADELGLSRALIGRYLKKLREKFHKYYG